MNTHSLWSSTAVLPRAGQVMEDGLHADVAIIGGGITGVTAAKLLSEAGRNVALLEARELGGVVTRNTSAHLTQALDLRYSAIERDFGAESAALVASAGADAIAQIARLIAELRVDCQFERLPGYLFTQRQDDVPELEAEYEAARKAGLEVSLTDDVPLPLRTLKALRFDAQAQFHPLTYVATLANSLSKARCRIFENSRVLTLDEGEPCRLHLEDGRTLTANRVIIATHAPIHNALLGTKVAQYRSYVISGPVQHAGRGMFWDTLDPYHYIRYYQRDGHNSLILGGEDHKTGQSLDEAEAFERLQAYGLDLGLHSISHSWSAQVVETVDGLPFIGKNAQSEYVYVATGFSGNGLTLGTLAAMMLSDACRDIPNPYAALFTPSRVKPLTQLRSFLGENIDFPLYLLSDNLKPPEAKFLSEIKRGEGKTIRIHGERLAVYRDDSGALHGVSPVCTHLGCHVHFNSAEKTWDCPCHGSRFTPDGAVLDGPALTPLQRRVPIE